MESDFKPFTAIAVFTQVESTGRHAALTAMPLHEVVVARLRVEAVGESLIVIDAWPEWSKDSQMAERSVGSEYARMLREYGKDLLVSVYGNPHEGRLQKVMTRIHEAFLRGAKTSKIVDLGRPESDFIELPGGPQSLASTIMGKDTDESKKVDSSLLRDDGETPEGVVAIGEDVEDEPSIDGNLVAFLADSGWNEPQALAVARIVLECGIQSIPDAKLMTVPGVKNAEAKKTLRQHLVEYRSRPVATG
jgi:hypothetical protein